jgi:ankyrin repeat protein
VDPRTVPWAEVVAHGARPWEWTELAWAVENLEVEEVRRLLQAGADPNAKFMDGKTTILHWALDAEGVTKSYEDDSYGCEIAKLLVSYGADITATDASGRTPLECARLYLDTGAADVLAEALEQLNANEGNREAP